MCAFPVLPYFSSRWDYSYGAWLRQWSGDAPISLFTQQQCPSPVWKSKLFTWAVYSFYISKYVEYLDTAWLVLKVRTT